MVQRRNSKISVRSIPLRLPPANHNTLRPVTLSLYPLGLDCYEFDGNKSIFEKIRRRLNLRTTVCLIAVHLVVLHTLSNSFYYAIKKRQLSLAFGNLAGLLRALSAAISLDYFIRNKANVYKCIWGVNGFRSNYLSTQVPTRVPGKLFCRCLVLFFWIFILTKVILPLIFAKHLEPKFYIEMFMYDINFLHNLNPDAQRLACCIELFLYQCIVSIKHFAQLVVACSVGVTCRKVNFLTQVVRNDNALDSQVLSIWHTDLFGLVRKLDKYFRFLYFVWMCEWMTSLVLNVPKLLTNKKSDNLFANVLSYMDIFSTLLVSIFVSVTMSEVACKQDDLMRAVHHRLASQSIVSTNRKGHLADSYLLIKLGTAKLCMTIFKCFVVTKTFIISLYGAVFTYITFIAQELQNEAF